MALNVRQKGFELILALILFFAATLLLIFVRYINWITLICQLATDFLLGPSQQCNSGVRFEVRGIVRGMDLPLSSTMRFDTVIKHKAVTMRISDS